MPDKVGSPLSIKSLREDLQVDHKTVDRWLQVLEHMYVCFRLSPYGPAKVRAVKKERKLYLWDWSSVEEAGPRFENLVASQLLKYCHWVEDTEGHDMELRFLRDTDRREIDFVVLRNRRPLFAVECKTGEKAVSPAVRYFAKRSARLSALETNRRDPSVTRSLPPSQRGPATGTGIRHVNSTGLRE